MMAEHLFEDEEHHVETFDARHFQTTVEIWCPQFDETKAILGHRYVRNCPMCGGEIDAEAPKRLNWSRPAEHPDGCECSWCASPQDGRSQ